MFFSDKISNIPEGYKVLEVGPGGNPHPRADVLLDKKFNTDDLESAQRGYAPKPKIKKEIIYYDGSIFPFKNHEFDYVICTHVLEHVPFSELEKFINELQRVSKAGFIEFPNVYYELINHQDVHLWHMNYRDNTVLFLDKQIFKSNFIHKTMREMFYGRDKYMSKIFDRYRELFFSYFEWEGTINYKIVNNYEELVNEDDFMKYKEYFRCFQQNRDRPSISFYLQLKSLIYNFVSRLKGKWG